MDLLESETTFKLKLSYRFFFIFYCKENPQIELFYYII